MLMGPDQIRDAIARGEIAALALDTSVFDRQHRKLERGLLGSLRQFRNTNWRTVLTDVVVSELHAHIKQDVEAARAALDNALRELSRSHNFSQEQVNAAKAALRISGDSDAVARKRIDEFLEATGATQIAISTHASTDKVFADYFAGSPPFDSSRKQKKSEFPDAFSLHALEGWAVNHGTKILVVSGDQGWNDFCKHSQSLVGVTDLAEALGYFQEPSAQLGVVQISESLVGDTLMTFRRQVEEVVRGALEGIPINEDVDSMFAFDLVGLEASLLSMEFTGRSGTPDLELVEVVNGRLIARVPVDADLKVSGSFSFSKWDGEDRTMIPMGFAELSVVVSQTLEILAAFAPGADGPTAVNIELVPTEIHADFGDIVPDWMSDHDPR
jgi:hypothetical protein